MQDLLYTSSGSLSEEFVTMRPSAAWLRFRQQAGQCTLKHILRQMFEGLSSLHERGVTHRDLKPSNTILRIDGAGSSSRGFGVRGATTSTRRMRLRTVVESPMPSLSAWSSKVRARHPNLRALAAPGSSAGGGGDGADGDGPHNGAGDGGGQAGGSGGQSRAGAGPTPSVRLETLAPQWTRRSCSAAWASIQTARAWTKRRRGTSLLRPPSAASPTTCTCRFTTSGRWEC